MTHTKIILTIVGLTALALLATACSPSAAKLTGTGNEAFAQQAYEEALRSYQQAQAESPALAEPHYNAANVLYREGKYEEALKELQKAASFPEADKVAQASLFNAGNSAYNTKSWEAAIESYRQALLRNPDDVDAKHNLELALQQQQQEQQKQDQQKQDQQQQDQQSRISKAGSAEPRSAKAGSTEQDQQNKMAKASKINSRIAGWPRPAGSAKQDQQNPSQSDQGQQDTSRRMVNRATSSRVKMASRKIKASRRVKGKASPESSRTASRGPDRSLLLASA